MEEGIFEGEICNRDGCKGIIEEKDLDGGCSCHISPPCSYCETSREFCEECGWDAEDEKWKAIEKSTPIFKQPTEEERKKSLEKRYSADDGKLYKIERYFDSVFEGTNGRDMKLGDANRELDRLVAKPAYYVSYSIKEQ